MHLLARVPTFVRRRSLGRSGDRRALLVWYYPACLRGCRRLPRSISGPLQWMQAPLEKEVSEASGQASCLSLSPTNTNQYQSLPRRSSYPPSTSTSKKFCIATPRRRWKRKYSGQIQSILLRRCSDPPKKDILVAAGIFTCYPARRRIRYGSVDVSMAVCPSVGRQLLGSEDIISRPRRQRS